MKRPKQSERAARRWVLFICTGNYYRSRFAEAVFNHHALRRRLPWRAFSRGLAIHLVDGDLSPFARAGLKRRRICLAHTASPRASLRLADLRRARVRVALDAREHGPMLAAKFPAWLDRIEFWEVADVELTAPDRALKAIEAKVRKLLDALARRDRRQAM
jgi:protein-tyrosine phosphatase